MEAVVERTTKSEKRRYPIVGALQMHVMVFYETCWHAAMVDVELHKPLVCERDREFDGGDVGERKRKRICIWLAFVSTVELFICHVLLI